MMKVVVAELIGFSAASAVLNFSPLRFIKISFEFHPLLSSILARKYLTFRSVELTSFCLLIKFYTCSIMLRSQN